MKLKDKTGCGCNKKTVEQETIQDVIEVLEREVSNYSTEHVPERITRLRNYIQKLNTPCSP